jgi:cytochrome P450
MGGSDTTSNTLEFALLAMIRNPEVQAKVQEEIDSVIGQTRLPTLADRAQ